jgi:hypothetical protein
MIKLNKNIVEKKGVAPKFSSIAYVKRKGKVQDIKNEVSSPK